MVLTPGRVTLAQLHEIARSPTPLALDPAALPALRALVQGRVG